MATTFSVAFKNIIINSIAGSATTATTTSMAYFINPYSGTQTALPTDTPGGSFAYTTGTNSVGLNTYMTQGSGGISQLSSSRQGVTAANNALTLTTARIYASNGTTALMDTPLSLVGGGGGVIVPTLTSSTGTNYVVDAFSIKMPANSGTVYLNVPLRNAIVESICVAAANIGAGTSAAINVYSGSVPASADAPLSGNTLLVSFTTAASGASWSTASGGSASLASNLSAVASAGSATTATFARIVKGNYIIQGTVGTSGADFTMDSVTITSGNTYLLTNATITL